MTGKQDAPGQRFSQRRDAEEPIEHRLDSVRGACCRHLSEHNSLERPGVQGIIPDILEKRVGSAKDSNARFDAGGSAQGPDACLRHEHNVSDFSSSIRFKIEYSVSGVPIEELFVRSCQ